MIICTNLGSGLRRNDEGFLEQIYRVMPLLDHVQIFTFLVFLTFYVPCLSTFAVKLKTLGRREAWFSVMISLVSALLMADAVRLLLELARLIT